MIISLAERSGYRFESCFLLRSLFILSLSFYSHKWKGGEGELKEKVLPDPHHTAPPPPLPVPNPDPTTPDPIVARSVQSNQVVFLC